MEEYVIGIDLGGTNIRIGAVDKHGNIVLKEKKPSLVNLGKESVVKEIFNLISNVISTLEDKKLVSIGIGVPGVICHEKGIVSQSPNFPDWQDFHLKDKLESRITNPFVIANDANCATIGEGWIGAAKGIKNYCCLTLGTGIGGGIVLNDELWTGSDGVAGELGHIIIDPKGPLCGCGSMGCLEAYASATAIINKTKARIKRGDPGVKRLLAKVDNNIDEITPLEIFSLASDFKDPFCLDIFNNMGHYLGIGFTTIVNMLNIDMIVLGGGMSGAWDLFIHSAIEELKKRAYKIPANRVKIVQASNGDNAGIIGAAYLAYNLLKQHP